MTAFLAAARARFHGCTGDQPLHFGQHRKFSAMREDSELLT